MPKEQLEFDFTKDFTSREMFALLKDEIYRYCEKRYEPFPINYETINCGFDTGCLDYEVNNKLYSVMKFHIYVRLGSQYGDFSLIITPFNCYVRKWGDEQCLTDEKKNIDLTNAFRKIMKDKYGKDYIDAGKNFAKEVKDLREGLEEDLFNHKKKLLNIAYNEEVESFEI